MANRPVEPAAEENGAVEGDEPRPRCRLYLITPPDLAVDGPALEAFGEVLAEALDAGDVACVQLRLKDVTDDDWRRAAAALAPIVQSRDVAFILNDRADLVAELGADGAHIGQGDIGYARARQLVGDDAILGVTCKASRDLATDAVEAGADYVAFGAFFESTTKEVSKRIGLEILTWWSAVATTPAVAIGGITPENCAPVIRAGADFLAAAGGVWRHPDGPAAAVRAFNAAIDGTPHEDSPVWETEP